MNQCIGCGCTDWRACFDTETGDACRWSFPPIDGKGICTVCARTLPALARVLMAGGMSDEEMLDEVNPS